MSGRAFTVSELTAIVGDAVARAPELEDVLVEGEISNLTTPASGHVYLTLKDRGSALSCVCFRTAALRVPFAPRNGMTVLAHGVVSVYPQQGRYQLVIDRLEPSGVGALALAVEQRKRALAAEGLFDERHKRPLPLLPARVAVVTSRTAAALHDVVTVSGRRAPSVDLVISPATMQGDGAADTIVAALRRAGRARGVQVVLLVRGGGSLEDLMAFNDERVARAIRACPVPVVTGVGHETDITIADLAADRRAATPSAAAETVVPSSTQLSADLEVRRRRLRGALRSELDEKRRQAGRRLARLDELSPARQAARMRQDVRVRDARLTASLRAAVSTWQRDLERRRGALELHSPLRALPLRRERLAGRSARLAGAARSLLVARSARLATVSGRLEALSPLRVIERGYSITVEEGTGRVVRSATSVAEGTTLLTRLIDGTVRSRVVAGGAGGRERMYDGEPPPATEDNDG